MRILTLDLGTKTGWALYAPDDLEDTIQSGTWALASARDIREQAAAGKNRTRDVRFFMLRNAIEKLLPLDQVWFEDVEFSTYTYQTQLWAGFRTVVSLLSLTVDIHCCPVGTLKKFATGRGNANKEAMGTALCSKYPTQYSCLVSSTSDKVNVRFVKGPEEQRNIIDDNEIDAIHLLRYALWQMNLKI